MIHLITRSGGNANDISKWRSITFLNTIYKLLAKIVAHCQAQLLPQLIHVSQRGFLKNQSILDELFSFLEAVSLAKCTNNKIVVVLLDFEKEYDMVCWNFLESMMGKLGFQESWIKGTTTLYRNANNCVSLTGERGPFFQILRSMR